jgi:hypothetical protein
VAIFEDLEQKRLFWWHVYSCLITFHNKPADDAKKLIRRLRSRFPLKSSNASVQLIYHFEPFRLACEIAKRKLDLKKFVKEYQEILESRPKAKSKRINNKVVEFEQTDRVSKRDSTPTAERVKQTNRPKETSTNESSPKVAKPAAANPKNRKKKQTDARKPWK